MPVEEWPTAPLLAAKGISKSYGSHRVLSDIDFTLHRGEAVAVIGENGAGKSTFAKITAGVIRPDEGELLLEGRSVSFSSPREALRHGIAFIPQELAYVPQLTVGENILLGRWPSRLGFVSHRRVLLQARDEARRYGSHPRATRVDGRWRHSWWTMRTFVSPIPLGAGACQAPSSAWLPGRV